MDAQINSVSKRSANLLRWIDQRYMLHIGALRQEKQPQLPRGEGLRLAKARRALLRSDIPKELKKPFLKEIDHMLVWHADLACQSVSIPFRSRSTELRV